MLSWISFVQNDGFPLQLLRLSSLFEKLSYVCIPLMTLYLLLCQLNHICDNHFQRHFEVEASLLQRSTCHTFREIRAEKATFEIISQVFPRFVGRSVANYARRNVTEARTQALIQISYGSNIIISIQRKEYTVRINSLPPDKTYFHGLNKAVPSPMFICTAIRRWDVYCFRLKSLFECNGE
jgi:hypothetical protein